MADIDMNHPEALLLLSQHGLCRGEGRQHKVVYLDVGFLHATDQIFTNVARARYNVRLDVEPEARKSDGVAYPFLTIDRIGAWYDVEDIAPRRQRDRPSGVLCPRQVVSADHAVG